MKRERSRRSVVRAAVFLLLCSLAVFLPLPGGVIQCVYGGEWKETLAVGAKSHPNVEKEYPEQDEDMEIWKKTGYFTLKVIGDKMSSVKIKAEYESTDDTKPQTVKLSVVKGGTVNNHNIKIVNVHRTKQGSTRYIEKAWKDKNGNYVTGTGEDGEVIYKTNQYMVLVIEFSYEREAFTYPAPEQEVWDGMTRFNTKFYDGEDGWKNQGESSLCREVYHAPKTETFTMQLSLVQTGVYGSHAVEGVYTINLRHPQLEIKYDGNGATGGNITRTRKIKYDQSDDLHNFSAFGLVREGYRRKDGAEWNTKADGSGKSFDQDIAYRAATYLDFTDGTRFREKSITVYAQWMDTYIIHFEGNGADGGSTADMICNYGKTSRLTANGFTRTGYSFAGWNTIPEGTGKSYADAQKVSDTGNLTLYAQWRINHYHVALNAGAGIASVDGSGRYAYRSEVTVMASVRPGYRWKDWTGSYSADTAVFSFEMPAMDVEMTAVAEANPYTIRFVPNGGMEVEHIDDRIVQYDQDIVLPDGSAAYRKYTRGGVDVTAQMQDGTIMPSETTIEERVYPSVFLGWAPENGKDSFTPQWKAGQSVKNLAEEEDAVVLLYAVWDDCPWIAAKDLYYTLEQAQSGYITETELLRHATASDREDGSPIAPGFHRDGTSFSIPDYRAADFTQFEHGGSCTENLTVVDSAGSIYEKQIRVYVVDTEAVAVKPEGTTRFISETYLNAPYEKGGLKDESVWKTRPEYMATLMSAFANMKNCTPEQTYIITHEEVIKMKEYIDAEGAGKTKDSGALERFFQRFLK